MSIKYKGLSKKNVRTSTMRNWFSSILEQTGGMTRYVDMLNKRDEKGIYTASADKLYTEMLDKCIKLEPRESNADSTITIKLDIPDKIPQLDVLALHAFASELFIGFIPFSRLMHMITGLMT